MHKRARAVAGKVKQPAGAIVRGAAERSYGIAEMAREFGVTARALRFYEDKGLIAPRREGQVRLYSARDRARLALVLRGRRVGFTLKEIKQALDLYDLGDDQRAQLLAAQAMFERQLPKLRQQRQDLEDAIEELERGLAWVEERLAKPSVEFAAARAYDEEARRRLDAE